VCNSNFGSKYSFYAKVIVKQNTVFLQLVEFVGEPSLFNYRFHNPPTVTNKHILSV